MRRGFVLVTLVLVSMLAACGPSTAGSSEPDTAKEKAPKPTMSTAENPKLTVGETAITTEAGNKLTVHSYESPLSPKGSKPNPGFEFSAIDVEGCASPTSARDLMHIGPVAFTLQMPDGARVMPEVFGNKDAEVKEPALQTMDPGPGTCERGFVTYQTPRDERPELVIFKEQFVTNVPDIAWKIPDER